MYGKNTTDPRRNIDTIGIDTKPTEGAQWLSGRVLDSRPKGRGFEPHRRHCVVSLSKNINPSLVLVPPRKTRPFITERLLMGRKETNQTNQTKQNPQMISRVADTCKNNSSKTCRLLFLSEMIVKLVKTKVIKLTYHMTSRLGVK